VSAGPGTGTPAPGASSAASDAPVPSDAETPGASPSEAPSFDASPSPSEAPPSERPSSTAGTGPAAACAGTAENRDFYAAVADAVSWPVYCPVLGSGWHVDAGQYRLAGGGWMEIAYKGPGGARLAFREGAACTTAGCQPTGTDAGPAAFGDLDGTLLQLDGGDLAVVVDPGATPSWSIKGSGLDQADFVAIAAGLARVGD
jgi:hypothetical protein